MLPRRLVVAQHRTVSGVRWIVDAMNVVGSRPDGWWRDRDGAIAALVGVVDRWAAATGATVTVVLERPPDPPLRAAVAEIAWAPIARPNSADDEIVRLVEEQEMPADVRVVTSDGELGRRVRAAGAAVVPARGFRDLVDPPR
jgi:hypothetical protein